MAARKTSKLSGTIKRETQNEENNKIKLLCKFLRNLQVEHSGPSFTKTKQKDAVKGGSECQNYGSKTEQVNRIWKESGKKTSAGEISKSSSKSEVKRHCTWNDYGLAMQYKQLEAAGTLVSESKQIRDFCVMYDVLFLYLTQTLWHSLAKRQHL